MSRTTFDNERTVLTFLSDHRHANIVQLLFWYEHNRTYNLVFPLYEGSLRGVLRSDWVPGGETSTSIRFRGSGLDHWLWQEMVDVTGALKWIHAPPSKGRYIVGHFDLKPANILISFNGRLVIADFGLAKIKSMEGTARSDFTDPGGTRPYRPPPRWPHHFIADNPEPDDRAHRSYDIWSLACIMTEVVTYIRGEGHKAVRVFETARKEEDTLSDTSPSFWRRGSNGKPCLKPTVAQLLMDLERSTDEYLRRIGSLLEDMFAIRSPNVPPTASACYDRLSPIQDTEATADLVAKVMSKRKEKRELCGTGTRRPISTM